jgi:hypothetical protein
MYQLRYKVLPRNSHFGQRRSRSRGSLSWRPTCLQRNVAVIG